MSEFVSSIDPAEIVMPDTGGLDNNADPATQGGIGAYARPVGADAPPAPPTPTATIQGTAGVPATVRGQAAQAANSASETTQPAPNTPAPEKAP